MKKLLSLIWLCNCFLSLYYGYESYIYLSHIRLIPPYPVLNFIFLILIGFWCFIVFFGLFNNRSWVKRRTGDFFLLIPMTFLLEVLVFNPTPILIIILLITTVITFIYLSTTKGKHSLPTINIGVPDDWSYKTRGDLIKIKNSDNKIVLEIKKYKLTSFEMNRRTPEDNIRLFTEYVSKFGYQMTEYGFIEIQSKNQFWGRYILAGFMLMKRYSILINDMEIIATGQLGYDRDDKDLIDYYNNIFDEIMQTIAIYK
ncbi:MAG: hypothetical protein JXB50_14275 [Spirochaetes bacterium]|nr:hypothetical protein [Spirochaetota bacterium]